MEQWISSHTYYLLISLTWEWDEEWVKLALILKQKQATRVQVRDFRKHPCTCTQRCQLTRNNVIHFHIHSNVLKWRNKANSLKPCLCHLNLDLRIQNKTLWHYGEKLFPQLYLQEPAKCPHNAKAVRYSHPCGQIWPPPRYQNTSAHRSTHSVRLSKLVLVVCSFECDSTKCQAGSVKEAINQHRRTAHLNMHTGKCPQARHTHTHTLALAHCCCKWTKRTNTLCQSRRI